MSRRFEAYRRGKHVRVHGSWLHEAGGGRIGHGLGLLAGLAVAIGGGPAFGHDDPSLLPPGGDYRVKWYQPHGAVPVEDWDIEVTPIRDSNDRFVVAAQVVPELSCWALDVPVDEPAVVRVRSVYGDQLSAWSRPTSVPEPGFAGACLAAVAWLGALARRRSRRLGR